MDLVRANALIDEFSSIGEQIKILQARRSEISSQFPQGRTEGETMAMYVSPPSIHTHFDARLLKKFVPQSTLDLCRVSGRSKGSARLVPKAKPKKEPK